MAKTPAQNGTPSADGAAQKRKQPARPPGPTKLYVVLQPGSDVNMVRSAIEKATTNRSELLDMLTGDQPRPVLTFTVQRGKRGQAGQETESVSVETGPGSAG